MVFSFGHLTFILSLHYLVKCKGHSLTFTTMNSYWVAHMLAYKITETTK